MTAKLVDTEWSSVRRWMGMHQLSPNDVVCVYVPELQGITDTCLQHHTQYKGRHGTFKITQQKKIMLCFSLSVLPISHWQQVLI